MNKLFQRIFWRNNNTPALNETNLNAMSKAIDDIDDRVIELGDDVLTIIPQIQAYLEQADDLVEAMEALSQNPPYIGTNGNWWVWNTSTQAFVDSGIDASITVQIADITMLAPDGTPYVTNSGTDTDPVFHLFIPRGQTGQNGQNGQDGEDGQDGVSPTITITAITGGHAVTITDATHPSGQTFNVMDGTGGGDMMASTYDPNGNVATAGGIKAYGDANYKGINAHDSWSEVTNKPFNTMNSGLFDVVNGELRTQAGMVTGMWEASNDGSATSAGYRGIGYYFLTNAGVVENWGVYTEFVMKQTATATSYTFTNSTAITNDRLIDVYSSISGETPTSVTQSGSTVTVTFAESKARTVAIVLK